MKPKINYLSIADEGLASFRYRIVIPASQMQDDFDILITKKPAESADVFVISKHFDKENAYKALEMGRPVIMDVCDNHFANDSHGPYYRRMCNEASLVTCNSREMESIIRDHAPDAVIKVIPEPYEMPELNPFRFVDNPPALMWFGHSSNLDTLENIPIPGKIRIVSDIETREIGDNYYYTYSHKMLMGVAGLADAVIIPTDMVDPRKRAKSANRFVEALRLGKFVIASDHPAHTEFARFGFIGDVLDGCKWMVENFQEARNRILEGQGYIRERFSPESVSARWRIVFETTLNGG